MQPKRKPVRPTPAPAGAQFLTDQEAAFELGLGMTKLFDLQRTDPTFPAPVWHGPRSKRHVRAELQAYALSKRERIVEPAAPVRRRGGVEIEVKA